MEQRYRIKSRSENPGFIRVIKKLNIVLCVRKVSDSPIFAYHSSSHALFRDPYVPLRIPSRPRYPFSTRARIARSAVISPAGEIDSVCRISPFLSPKFPRNIQVAERDSQGPARSDPSPGRKFSHWTRRTGGGRTRVNGVVYSRGTSVMQISTRMCSLN